MADQRAVVDLGRRYFRTTDGFYVQADGPIDLETVQEVWPECVEVSREDVPLDELDLLDAEWERPIPDPSDSLGCTISVPSAQVVAFAPEPRIELTPKGHAYLRRRSAPPATRPRTSRGARTPRRSNVRRGPRRARAPSSLEPSPADVAGYSRDGIGPVSPLRRMPARTSERATRGGPA